MSSYLKLIQNYADRQKTTFKVAKQHVDTCFDAMRDTLADPEVDVLSVRNFGRFKIFTYKPRKMQNNLDGSGSIVDIPKKERVCFAAYPLLRDMVQKQ